MSSRYMDIGEQLKAAIRDSGLTVEKVGEKAGLSKGQLSLFINGHRTLTLKSAAKLINALGLEVRVVKRVGRTGRTGRTGR